MAKVFDATEGTMTLFSARPIPLLSPQFWEN